MGAGPKYFHKQGLARLYELCIIHIIYCILFVLKFGLFWGLIYGYLGYCVFYTIMDWAGYEKVPTRDVLPGVSVDPDHCRNI